jgi:hypothetical protein
MSKDYEKLGAFYLGRRVDPASGAVSDEPLLYDSRDLTTHGVIIGMTGSGKTGLGIGLLEEAAMDRIPVIAVDPKGDLANMLLTFPDLAPADFEPWVDADAAQRQGLDRAAYAAQQAELWRSGLATGTRTEPASASCGRPRISPSTRRAAPRVCRCPCCAPSTRRRRSSWRTPTDSGSGSRAP